jgi:hypothetical protein
VSCCLVAKVESRYSSETGFCEDHFLNDQKCGCPEEFESEERPRHRLSCASALNDLTGKLLEDDLTDALEFGPLVRPVLWNLITGSHLADHGMP